MLAPDQIIAGVRSGRCRKISVPNFINTSYFADREGNIYSLNRPTEPKLIDGKMGNGLMWVTLFEQEGLIRRLMVGEVIAHTFLERCENDEFVTVMYKDGNPTNNAVDNLEWATEGDQQRQLREKQLEPPEDVESGSVPCNKNGNELSEIPFASEPETDPLLDQLHATQRRLEAEERTASRLRTALAPFATFKLAPAHSTASGTQTVLEANKGGNQHSVLSVQDFRAARAAFEQTSEDDR